MSFQDRTIFITGASSGLGLELARQLSAEGARLALFARRGEQLAQLVKELAAKGCRAAAYAVDVTDGPGVAKAMAAAKADLGPCDVLIANAGIDLVMSARRFDAAKFRQVFDVNVQGVAHAVEAVLPDMLERKTGHLVGISSLASYLAFPANAAYCASKAALSMMLDGLHMELAPKGIAVTTVCPGFIRTEMTAGQNLKMPMILDCDVATRRIVRAIRRRQAVLNFPAPMYWGMQALGFLPIALRAKLFQAMLPARR